MEIFEGNYIDRRAIVESVFMTVGNFDGLHLGHQFLISHLLSRASGAGKTLALSFSPHPSHVLGQSPCELLFSEQDKKEQFRDLCIDYLVVQDFSLDFAQMSAEDFLRQYLFPVFKPHFLLLGHDFNFGRGGEGDDLLAKEVGAEFNCQVEKALPYHLDQDVVSSSLIRQFIKDGNVEKAQRFLGRPFYVEGTVVKGASLGKSLGFPTANIDQKSIVPGLGVYAGVATYNSNVYGAVLNVGKRPTVDKNGDVTVECHLFDFDQEIYGDSLKFTFLKKIRDEKKFSGKVELMEQISKDVEVAKSIIKGSSFFES